MATASLRAIALIAAGIMGHVGMVAPIASSQQPAPVEQTAQTFDAPQLDALLAPSRYPDQLLTQLLIAVTFPLQIVEASRWLDDPAHKSLTGRQLTDALQQVAWDPSVKSLVAFPQVLAQLNGNLNWMQQLGFAVVQQQKDVLDAVQRLRRQAQAQGHLQSSPQQVVRTDPQPSGPPTVVIEPAQPDIVYVPTYNPGAVYGAWPYPSYPPVALALRPAMWQAQRLSAGSPLGPA